MRNLSFLSETIKKIDFSAGYTVSERLLHLCKTPKFQEMWPKEEQPDYNTACVLLEELCVVNDFSFAYFEKKVMEILGPKLGIKFALFLGLDRLDDPIWEVIAAQAAV